MAMVMFQAHNWPRVIDNWPDASVLADGSTGEALMAESMFAEWLGRIMRARTEVINFGDTTEATRSAGQLTAKGQREAAANLAERQIMPVLSALRAMIEDMDAREASVRKVVADRLIPNARTPTEVQLRSEIRFHVRDMPPAERALFIERNADTLTLAALMEAPPYLCGLTEADRARIIDAGLTEREGMLLSMIDAARHIARNVLLGAWAVAEEPMDRDQRAAFADVLGVKPSPMGQGEQVAA